MKKIYFAAVFITLFAGVLYSYSNNHKTPATIAPISITGLWADSNSAAFTNCHAIFSEKDGKVSFAHYLEFNGTGMVEEGKGTITGNKVQYDVIVTKAIPGWALAGTHILTLSDDGKKLSGIFKDAKGNTGPIVFVKRSDP